MGTLKGDQLSAADWTTVTPNSVTIAAHQERKIRITVAMPAEANRTYYYAVVTATMTKNGEAAGTTKVLVAAHTKSGVAVASMHPAAKLTVGHDKGSSYSLSAAFANDGEMHLKPHVTFSISDTAGLNQLKSIDSDSEVGTVLPLSIARFSGALDASTLKPGAYAVTATCTYGDGKKVTSTAAMKVTKTAAGASVEMIQTATAAPAPAKPAGKRGG